MMGMVTSDRHSRLVLWLKIALPLLALGILSTLFFVAETLDPEAAIPYAKVDVARVLRDQGVTAPSFGGMSSSGVTMSLTAMAIRPDGQEPAVWKGNELKALINLPSGAKIEVESPEGFVNIAENTTTLTKGARLVSSSGYVVRADSIVAAMNAGTVFAKDGIVATGPAGDISAGRMELSRVDTTPPSHHLVFQDQVRLVLRPEN